MSLTSYRAAPPRAVINCNEYEFILVLKKPGSDLLSHALRRSTIGAEDFYFRVRNGIGYGIFAITTRLFKYQISLLNHHREKDLLLYKIFQADRVISTS